MSTQDIVQKLWNLCNVLRDDGITYLQYVTELTYILFLKMADETGADKDIPEAYRWGSLTSRSGIDLKALLYAAQQAGRRIRWPRGADLRQRILQHRGAEKPRKNHHGD